MGTKEGLLCVHCFNSLPGVRRGGLLITAIIKSLGIINLAEVLQLSMNSTIDSKTNIHATRPLAYLP